MFLTLARFTGKATDSVKNSNPNFPSLHFTFVTLECIKISMSHFCAIKKNKSAPLLLKSTSNKTSNRQGRVNSRRGWNFGSDWQHIPDGQHYVFCASLGEFGKFDLNIWMIVLRGTSHIEVNGFAWLHPISWQVPVQAATAGTNSPPTLLLIGSSRPDARLSRWKMGEN